MQITINSGTTFLISDELGDIIPGTELGLYHDDTRFVSCLQLSLDGNAPLLLAARPTATNASAHYLTNPGLPSLPRGQLSIIRRRRVAHGLHEQIEITNYGEAEAAFALQAHLGADFRHIFEAKHEVEGSKDSLLRRGRFGLQRMPDGREHRFFFEDGPRAQMLLVRLSSVAETVDDLFSFAVRLAPQQVWSLTIEFLTLEGRPVERLDDAAQGEARAHDLAFSLPLDELVQAGHAQHERLREHCERLVASAPELETDSLTLRRAYQQSVHDFAALQIEAPSGAGGTGANPDDGRGEFTSAAGIPWFMTLFGRDSLITAYQALPFFPESAAGTLRALARLQGKQVDRLRAEEPGKILHEHRSPTFTDALNSPLTFPYYGTIDATPLFLKLLADTCVVTGDLGLARELRLNALAALDWIAQYGDRDGDGYLEYLRDGEEGLENQGWKDSGDSIRFRDGRLARGSIALCEVQGYVYAAKLGIAGVFATLGEQDRADRLRAEAVALKDRFNRDFWMEERGCYALALDGDKRQVDALTSNAGQVLWTGIADAEKARAMATRLVSPEFFSGWGVRTMATTEGGYNPISYHNGSVWPHDTGLIVAGLARYGFIVEAGRILGGMLSALDFSYDHRLPELFAGYSAAEAPFPVAYPTACRPQAWAAGSILLSLSVMTGADVGVRSGANLPFLAETVSHARLRGIWVEGGRADLEAHHSAS